MRQGYHLPQRQCMEAQEVEILLVLWHMCEMCDYLLQWHNLNFVFKFRVVEAASNQRESVIWILQGLLCREFSKPLYGKVNCRWRPKRILEYLLDFSCIPVARNPSINNDMTVPERKWGWAEEGTAMGKFVVLSCYGIDCEALNASRDPCVLWLSCVD